MKPELSKPTDRETSPENTVIRGWEPKRPPDSAIIWRYIDLAKFVSMLDTRCLYFANARSFDDPYEGCLALYDVKELRTRIEMPKRLHPELANHLSGDPAEKTLKAVEWYRSWCYASCWHVNDRESAALWKLYDDSGHVAIRSDVQSLLASMSEPPEGDKIVSGLVEYKDYNDAGVMEYFGDDQSGGVGLKSYGPLFFKRREFQHEQEFRVVLDTTTKRCNSFWTERKKARMAGDTRWIEPHKQINPSREGIAIPVELNRLVNLVMVSPRSHPMLQGVVKTLVERFDLSVQVERSTLLDAPVY